MLDDFHQPSVVDGIEESTDVRVEYPVHFLGTVLPYPGGYLPYPLQRISQIRGPNVGALLRTDPRLLGCVSGGSTFSSVLPYAAPGAFRRSGDRT